MQFNLGGYGYLRDVYRHNDQRIVKIEIINDFNCTPSRQDSVWLDATISDFTLLPKLYALLNKVKLGHSVILEFNADYRALAGVHSAIEPDDLKFNKLNKEVAVQVIMFEGKLVSVESYAVDGNFVKFNLSRDIQRIAA